MKEFLDVYRNLNGENLDRLQEIYTQEIRFIDPAHEISGLKALTDYFARLYENIEPPRFRFVHHLKNETEGYVQWEMEFSHAKLAGGRTIAVPGASFLRFDGNGKVFFHRDYFDLGAMLYEQLPVLGGVVKSIKRRLGS
jgi:hypothetical protein